MMKQLKQHGVLLLALVAVLCVAAMSAQAATLNVTVMDAETGEKLEGISITVMSQDGTSTEGVSDTAGMLEITDLTAGVYTIAASTPGYADKMMANVELVADGTTSVEIALSSEVIELDQVSVSASRRREKVLEAPASVALVSASQIKDRVAPSVTEHLKSVRGVDVVNTGIGTSQVVVRGFNNVFSGTLLSLVDNRIARVPSLRLNAYSLIPTSSEDIEQIEVVSGPGSALYGPNSANGVMHILTKSPFTSQGTTVSFGGGERSVLMGSLRHAGVINETFGYKLSVNGLRGNDWEEGRSKEDLEGPGEPIFDTYRAGGEARVDYKPNDDLTTILASGFTQTTGTELTGLGAGQAKNWTYGYVQGRFIYKDLFAQAFWNTSDAGDTYTLRDGIAVVDNSSLYVGQIQHGYSLGERQRFTYGLDLLLTRPETEGTINGRNEDSDNITEIGGYLQSETKLTSQLKFILAGRADNHNHLNDIVLSPRAALAFQPNDDHNLRLTYNRAFSTPSTSNLFLDRLAVPDAYGLGSNFQPILGFSPNIDIRAQGPGSDTGLTFKRDAAGRPLFRSPFSPVAEMPAEAHLPLDDPLATNLMWGIGRGAVMAGVQPVFEAAVKQTIQQTFTPQALPQVVATLPPETLQGVATQALATLPPQVLQGLPPEFAPLLQPGAIAAMPPEQLQQIVPQVLQALPPQVVQGLAASLAASTEAEILAGFANLIPEQVDGVKNVLRSVNPETAEFTDVEDVNDVDPLKPTITQTVEFGYKGILMNKLAFSADVYQTKINDFIGPLVVETPNVFLDAESLSAFLGQHFTAALSDPKNATLNQALLAFDAPAQGGNGNGSAVDELTKLFVAGTENNGPAFIPFGTVTPEEASDPNAVLLTYRNYGDISLYGLDCSLTYYLNPSLSIGGTYSFVSKDLFETEVTDRNIALNAPANKFGVNVQYINTNLGLGAGARMNYVAGFPVNSGVYIGEVEPYSTIDVNVGYEIPFATRPRLSLTVQNLLNTMYQPFIGAPEIGRLSLVRLTQTF
ncbi:TonB-dependent receptor plug domain-containing protein [Candidatus Poribacteria bacterium]|nr:TonB-dependent receptor plug domain-containing protein [Candidatus Poribacteria bacterium]